MTYSLDAIFFDLDGTLLNTAQDLANALNDVLIYKGKPAIPFEHIHEIVYLGAQRTLCKGFNIKPSDAAYPELHQLFLNAYQRRLTEHTHYFPDTRNLIKYLEEAQLAWGIVTNKPRWLTEPLLKHFKELNQHHCLVCGDSLQNRKPNPDPLQLACRLTQAAPTRSVYVGDTSTDIYAAKSAGLFFIFANYEGLYTQQQLIKLDVDHIITSPQAIIQWLTQFKVS